MGSCNNSSNDKRREMRQTENISENNNNSNQNLQAENKLESKMINNKEELNNSDSIDYYLICPDCSERSPHIEKLYYDEHSKEFLVKYTCVCNENTMHSKEIQLMKILNKKEPTNKCNIHLENKLINFCKTCRRALCIKCKEDLHKGHNIDEDNINNKISKEDADNMLKVIKEKEIQFHYEINENEKKMENGIDNKIQKLNEEKQNYKKQMENYKNKSQKTFDFLKNLYSRYINNFETQNIDNNLDGSIFKQDNNINIDIMLKNHISNFSIMDKNITQLNSNIDEIINQNNYEKKDLILNYDIGFPNNKFISNENINSINNIQNDDNFENYNLKNSNKKEKRDFICIKTLKGHSDTIGSLIELSSGKLLSGSYDNNIIIWNINNKERYIINENGRVFCLLEFEKGKILSGTSENCINLWDIGSNNGTYIYSFIGHELWVNSLVKCDNNYFASGSNDSNIKIWDYYNKICKTTLKGHVDCILSLIMLKNNYLCSGSADLTIRIWDWEDCSCISILKGHEKWVKCLLELENQIIVSGSDDKTIKLWKNNINIETLEGHTNSIRSICQINEKLFASGSFDCTIKIWEINSWKCVQTLYGHESNIICLISLNEHSSNNYIIASCSNDKTIKIWEGNP